MDIHHIGIAVESLVEAIPVFELLLGHPPDSTEEVKDQNVRVAVFHVGKSRIELLEAASEHSPIARFIDRRGPGIHHVALTVDNLQGTLDKLDQHGVGLIDRNPREGAGQESVAFLYPSSTAGVLFELVEEPKGDQQITRRSGEPDETR